jgi:hypothetical protein
MSKNQGDIIFIHLDSINSQIKNILTAEAF